MKSLMLLAFLLCTSCAAKFESYVLENGKIIQCKFVQMRECGIYAEECRDGREYFCQKNVSTIEPYQPGSIEKNINSLVRAEQ